VEIFLKQFEPEVSALADALRAKGLRIVTAESCTGGLIAAACTAVAGSSDWFERGFVTYSNDAKSESIGVDVALVATYGAVSGEVAKAMAEGALSRSRAQIAVAVTGIAGPGGGTRAKPVGTVWLAVAGALPDALSDSVPQTHVEHLALHGDRAAIREATVHVALQRLLTRALDSSSADR
jgi:nicotinamide-nucleotide amidase